MSSRTIRFADALYVSSSRGPFLITIERAHTPTNFASRFLNACSIGVNQMIVIFLLNLHFVYIGIGLSLCNSRIDHHNLTLFLTI